MVVATPLLEKKVELVRPMVPGQEAAQPVSEVNMHAVLGFHLIISSIIIVHELSK